MEKKVCVFLADGFEEIEGLTVVDLLRRAGIFVTTVSITGKLQIRGSHDICVQADKLFGAGHGCAAGRNAWNDSFGRTRRREKCIGKIL